jgi:ribonuclease HII
MGRDRWKPIERDLRQTAGPLIAGVDEVGRGPLAGPVVACACIMPPGERAIRGVDDSKQLTAAEREKLVVKIREHAVCISVGAASVREIDRLNIYHATVLAMRRALTRLTQRPHHVLIDGKPIRTLGIEHTAIVGGDDACYSIACASIVAKVTRDRYMLRAADELPGWHFHTNVGYSTPEHRAAIQEIGISGLHRRSFQSIAYQQLAIEG